MGVDEEQPETNSRQNLPKSGKCRETEAESKTDGFRVGGQEARQTIGESGWEGKRVNRHEGTDEKSLRTVPADNRGKIRR